MKTRAEKIRSFLLLQISKHPRDIVAVASNKFSVTRTTIHRHLNQLLKEKKLIKTGTTRNANYFLADALNKQLTFKLDDKLNEFDIWSQYLQQSFEQLPDNVIHICVYGFTEMLNNAINHSVGTEIVVNIIWHQDFIEIKIRDDGIGVFRNLQSFFGFEDMREGAVALATGKLTTDPKHHTGEGVFFTSKAFDRFTLYANSIIYHVDNFLEEDMYIETNVNKKEKGTLVVMEIQVDSPRRLENQFNLFTHPETKAFNKTVIVVKLSLFDEERFVSRSQAKRLLFGLDKFKTIVLDFEGVSVVGQGFVDEVFRVFKSQYPDIKIEYTHANDDVIFMIKRGIATAKKL